MTKEEALKGFYIKNGIKNNSTEDEYDANYDSMIANLPTQVDKWLANIDSADHEVFLNLLSRYTYLTVAECQYRYRRIIELLEEQLPVGTNLNDVLFITVESSSGIKSGSDNVSVDLQRRNMRKIKKHQIIRALSKVEPEMIEPYRVIVFLDDVIGSSETLGLVITTFVQTYFTSKENLRTYFYACIAPRKNGIRRIERKLKKESISAMCLVDDSWMLEDAFLNNSEEYNKIEKYEQIIGNYMMKNNESFFMGFEKNKLLLSLYYNTPNNTLSSFWREIPDKHTALFYRDGNQPVSNRPTIDNLKRIKKQGQSTAYTIAARKT